MPEISVIVPVYNASKYIRRCLDSLLSQSFFDIEIVVINDGSTDESLSIIKGYVDADRRVRAINQRNLGLGAARNRGINEARGLYLSFVDADDLAEPHMLESLYRALKEFDADISLCQLQRVSLGEEGKRRVLGELGFSALPLRKNVIHVAITGLEALQLQLDMISTVMGSACGKLIRRELFNNSDILFPEQHRFSEDAVTIAQLYLHARKVVLVRENLYEYVQTASSLTGSYSLKKAGDLITDMQEIKSSIDSSSASVNADNFYLANMFSAGKQVQWSDATRAEKLIARRNIQDECRRFHPDFRRKQMPLIYRLEAQISSKGLTSLACSLIRFFGWLPFVKRML